MEINKRGKKNLRGQIRTGLLLILIFATQSVFSQTETVPAGSFIINMGIVPQTVGNALKPYGMIYDLIQNYQVPIKWVIAPGKVKDGIDFTYNGVDFKGGPFIVLLEYRNAAVNSRIAYWQTQGVVGITTTSPIDVPVAMTLLVSSVPRWTMDLLNGKVAVPYFTNAGIPPTAYSLTKQPSELGYCDDIFVMPHAYPQWATHNNLYFWNKTYHGSIWLSCTAGSELEDMFNPADHSQQTNFLSEKDATVAFPATGQPTTIENALVLYNHHSSGTPPYSYANSGDQFMQFMGTIDAATQNGLEQIYIPKSPGWRSTTTIGAWDPDHSQVFNSDQYHRAAVIAYGHGFGDPTRGFVMIEAAHSLNNALLPPNIAAQRAFFNFSFMAGKDATVTPDVSGIPTSIPSGVPTAISFLFPVGINPNNFTVGFFSACGGSFASNPAFPGDKTKWIYTPPILASSTSCPITVSIGDACGRVYNTSKSSIVTCDLSLTTILASACNSLPNGAITMNITGAGGPYIWSWTRGGGGTGSGNGTVISGLSSGVYTVTVTSGNGAGCSKTFTVTISDSPAINALSVTSTNVLCNGLATGSINIANVSGGTPPFTFLWSDAATTQNRSGLVTGTYSVTAKDANNCSVSSSNIAITQPSAIVIIPSLTHVACFGQTTGAVSIAVSGGTGPYAFAWNDGASVQNRTGLSAGTYSVTISDANNCSQTLSDIIVSQPAAAISLSSTNVNAACYGSSTGTIDLMVTGGTLPYSYNWGGVTTEDRTALSAGNYSVTVTDTKNCSAVYTTAISQPIALSLSTSITNETCPNAADGAIVLTVSGGIPTYTYAWTGPSTFAASTKDIHLLKGGTYAIQVTDTNSCSTSASVTVNTTNSNPVAPATINN